MKVKADITLPYNSTKNAENIQKALEIDNGIFVISRLEDSILKASIESDSLSSFLQTIDDYLSCVSVAENVINTKNNSKDGL